MRSWWLFPVLLVSALTSTCIGQKEDPCRDSTYVLGSDPIPLYGKAGSNICVLPRKANETKMKDMRWFILPRNKNTRQVYKRLVLKNTTQLAEVGATVWYQIMRNGSTVYTSAKGTIRIGSAPVLIDLDLDEVIRVDRHESRSVCFLFSGVPRPEVTAYKVASGSQPPIPSNSSLRLSDSCLRIQNPHHEDGGRYVLELKNRFGTITKIFRLKVSEKPRITIDFERADGIRNHIDQNSLISMNETDNLALPYMVTGVPPPAVQWSHGHAKLDPSKYNSSHLTLRNVELSDAGEYVLIATNMYGETNRTFRLEVIAAEPPPIIEKTELPSTEATPSDAPTEISQFDKEIITVYLRENTENSVKPPSVRPDKQADPRDESGIPPWMLASIAGGGVALVVVVILVVVYSYRKGVCCKQVDNDSEKGDSLQRVLKPDDSLK
jgi:hypothetical protein